MIYLNDSVSEPLAQLPNRELAMIHRIIDSIALSATILDDLGLVRYIIKAFTASEQRILSERS